MKKINIFYKYLQFSLYNRFKNNYCYKTEVISFLHEWRIPKPIRIGVIEEMIQMRLIERVNRFEVKIKKSDFTNKPNKIYSSVGLLTL